MKNIVLTLVTIISFIFSQDCPKTLNTWFRIANDAKGSNYGDIMQLDMTKGLAGTDGVYVYLQMLDLKTDKPVIIAFPIGEWKDDAKIEEEFKDLEDYLKKNKGKGIKIEKTY
jgi:hypothetical protein